MQPEETTIAREELCRPYSGNEYARNNRTSGRGVPYVVRPEAKPQFVVKRMNG
jgi:hypothetical protein